MSEYPAFAVTADIALFTVRDSGLHILLVERAAEPYKDHMALPGGFVEPDEDAMAAAHRELAEETGLKGVRLEQLTCCSTPRRDPRQRVVTVVHVGLALDADDPVAGDDAAEARFVAVDELDDIALAFDHATIIEQAVAHVRGALEGVVRSGALLPDALTMGEARELAR